LFQDLEKLKIRFRNKFGMTLRNKEMSYKQKDSDYLKDKALETKLVRSGSHRSNYGETSEAIFMNSGFCYNNAETAESRFNGDAPGYVYSRYTNPSLRMLEEKLVALEENAEEACVVASGMAAVFASIMCDVKPGDHVIASKVLFGSCYYIVHNILPRLGVEITVVTGDDNEAWKNAFKDNTSHIFIETPANPTLGLVDIEYVSSLAKQANARVILIIFLQVR
jgi:O-succinylhomoserine sulfhydrylase